MGGLISADTYTIELLFSLDANDDGYQRIVSFDGLVEDYGQYAYDNYFYFYDVSPDLDNFTFAPDELVTLRLSRNGSTDLYSAYLNGNQLWDFTDSSDLAVITESGLNLIFFQDDGSEHASGFVDNIRIYDNPEGANGSVPVPSTALLITLGLAGGLSYRFWRNSK